MKASRAMCALAVAGVVLVSATTASAGWRGLSDLQYDDSGRVCTNAMEFSLTNLPPAAISVMVTNISADPDEVIVPPTVPTPLVFAPVPEFFFGEFGNSYLHSRSFRLDFSPRPAAGDTLMIEFSGVLSNTSTMEVVESCTLRTQLKLRNVLEPPALNVPADPSLVKIRFKLPGVNGANIFTEGPLFAPIPCSAPATPAFQQPTPAAGELRVKGNHRYVFRWEPPAGLSGCQELWFRNVEPGLSPTELGLSHRVLFDFGSGPAPG